MEEKQKKSSKKYQGHTKYFLIQIKNNLMTRHEATTPLSVKVEIRVLTTTIRTSKSTRISLVSKTTPSSSTNSKHTARRLSRTKMVKHTHFTATNKISKGIPANFLKNNSERPSKINSNLVAGKETTARVTPTEWVLKNTTQSSKRKNRITMTACDSSKKIIGLTIPLVRTGNGDRVPATQILSTRHLNNGCVIREWIRFLP